MAKMSIMAKMAKCGIWQKWQNLAYGKNGKIGKNWQNVAYGKNVNYGKTLLASRR